MFKRVLLPLLCLLILTLAAPAATAQRGTCALLAPGAGDVFYTLFPSSNLLIGTFQYYTDPDCQDPTGPVHQLTNGWALATSPEEAWSICQAHHGDTLDRVSDYWSSRPGTNVWSCIERESGGSRTLRALLGIVSDADTSEVALSACQGRFSKVNEVQPFSQGGPGTWMCFYVYQERFGSSGSRSSAGGSSSRTCGLGIRLPLTGLRLDAFDGMSSGIQFNRIEHCGVGDPAVIDMGFLDAVDIWSNIGSGYSVCFPQPGRIVFLDAATSPRTLIFPDYNHDDGWTCASLNIAGTMVLVEAADGTGAETSTAPIRRPGTDDSVDDAIVLENCLVTPRLNLRLRAAPWAKILDVIPRDTEVPAMARTMSWFHVTYDEINGWSAAWLADSDGDCDWTGGLSS